MGFWDGHVANLEALGISFTENEVTALNDGGRVLHLHTLPSPESYSPYGHGDAGVFYPNGSLVLVPEIIVATSPSDLYLASWKGKGLTVAEHMDADWSELWREIPSYLAILDEPAETAIGMPDMRTEDLHVYRWWGCVPLVTDDDQRFAEALVSAYEKWVHTTLYPAMCDVEQFAAYEEMCDPWDLWYLYKHSEMLRKKDLRTVEEWVAVDFSDQGYAEAIANMIEDLVQAKNLIPPGSTDEECQAQTPIFFPPLTDHLDPDAADRWRSLVARRTAIIARIEHAVPAAQRGTFRHNEGYFL